MEEHSKMSQYVDKYIRGITKDELREFIRLLRLREATAVNELARDIVKKAISNAEKLLENFPPNIEKYSAKEFFR